MKLDLKLLDLEFWILGVTTVCGHNSFCAELHWWKVLDHCQFAPHFSPVRQSHQHTAVTAWLSSCWCAKGQSYGTYCQTRYQRKMYLALPNFHKNLFHLSPSLSWVRSSGDLQEAFAVCRWKCKSYICLFISTTVIFDYFYFQEGFILFILTFSENGTHDPNNKSHEMLF